VGLVGVWTGFLDGMDFVHDKRSAWAIGNVERKRKRERDLHDKGAG